MLSLFHVSDTPHLRSPDACSAKLCSALHKRSQCIAFFTGSLSCVCLRLTGDGNCRLTPNKKALNKYVFIYIVQPERSVLKAGGVVMALISHKASPDEVFC